MPSLQKYFQQPYVKHRLPQNNLAGHNTRCGVDEEIVYTPLKTADIQLNFAAGYLTQQNILAEHIYKLDANAVLNTMYNHVVGRRVGNINYLFCDDEYLLGINQRYLNHDTYTDIITFDYVAGNLISGDIMISVDRVGENAAKFGVPFEQELRRVVVHGVLHLLGQGDKSDEESREMRRLEEEALSLFHGEQNV